MRFARSLPVVLLSLVVVAGCATASAGWTYAPAPTAGARAQRLGGCVIGSG